MVQIQNELKKKDLPAEDGGEIFVEFLGELQAETVPPISEWGRGSIGITKMAMEVSFLGLS